jgi:Histidine kinase
VKSRFPEIIIHLIGCLAFLSLPILFAPDLPIYWFQFDSYAFHKLALYLLLIGFFYLNYFLLIPKLYFSKRYLLYILACLLCFLFIFYIPDLILPAGSYDALPQTPLPPGAAPAFITDVEQTHFQKPFALPHISDMFFLYLIVLFVSMTLKINYKLKRSEKEKTEAQLSYLQSQINPHFLFNTLNSIYSLAVDEKSMHTAEAIVKLSGMMRYTTTETGSDLVPLPKEIAYISNYIDLQKIRMGNTVKVSYEATGDFTGKKIVPLILIPFIENAFKHGVNPEQDSQIKITIHVKDYELYLEVVNNKVYNVPDEAKTGVGITNTQKRLNFLYATRYKLSIRETDKQYSVNLHLNLQ